MAYSSWNIGKDARTFAGLCIGLIFTIFGGLIWFMWTQVGAPFLQIIFIIFLGVGVVLLIMGLVTLPDTRRRSRLFRQVLEIAAVEKEVTISDIHTRTGIDSETVREILVACLINRILFGYIEGELFVRDTSGRPPAYPGRMGMYGG